MSFIDKFGIPYAKKRKFEASYFEDGRWYKYYKNILEENENIKKQIENVTVSLGKLDYDKILEVETLIENGSKIGDKGNFFKSLTPHQLQFLTFTNEKIKKISTEFEILLANREKEIKNDYTEKVNKLGFKDLQIETRITEEFSKISDLVENWVRSIIQHEYQHKSPSANKKIEASNENSFNEDINSKVNALQKKLDGEIVRVIAESKNNAENIAKSILLNENRPSGSDKILTFADLKFKYMQLSDRITNQLKDIKKDENSVNEEVILKVKALEKKLDDEIARVISESKNNAQDIAKSILQNENISEGSSDHINTFGDLRFKYTLLNERLTNQLKDIRREIDIKKDEKPEQKNIEKKDFDDLKNKVNGLETSFNKIYSKDFVDEKVINRIDLIEFNLNKHHEQNKKEFKKLEELHIPNVQKLVADEFAKLTDENIKKILSEKLREINIDEATFKTIQEIEFKILKINDYMKSYLAKKN